MLAPRSAKLRSQRDVNLWRIPLKISLAAIALFGVTLIPDVLDAYRFIHLPSWLTMGGIDDVRAILSAMMGAVAPHRRGVAAGARMVLMNTGSILSIAFVLAVVTSAVPKATLFRIFSGLGHGLSSAKLEPFIANMHVALWAMAAASIVGALVSIMRPAHRAS